MKSGIGINQKGRWKQYFVKKLEGKTMRQGPFYLLQRHFGSTEYSCICTNIPSPPSDEPRERELI